MKHIKNSIKDGLFLLEHSGVPIAILTDFNESISNGSLCVDKTNQDLYILKSGAWVKYGSGFDGDTYIPLAGTKLNKPVTGNIEFMSGKKLYSGESSISLTNTRLILGFSDNNNTTSNFSYIYDKNVILLKNDCIITIDSNSKNNFIDRVSTKTSTGLVLSNSTNNYILSEIKKPLNMTQFSYSYIKGNFNDLNVAYNSHLNLNINEGVGVTGTIINFNSFVDFSISTNVIPTQPISLQYNSNSKIRINNIGNITTITSNNNYYYEGTIKDFIFYNNYYASLYGSIEKSTFNDSFYIYNLGHITNDTDANLFNNSLLTTSNMENCYGVYNIGQLGAIYFEHAVNTTLLGKNINTKIIFNNNDVFINTNGIETINNSFNNISINTTNRDFISSSIYSTIDDSSCNILFNNNIINMNSANNNFVVNVENVNMNGDNNFIFTPKSYNNAFTGTVNGDNNVIFSLDANKNYTINSNIFTFGTIYSTSGGLSIPSGNILLGNYEFNDTLTTNNIILGAKLLTNINHGNQINNIFLNVDNFIAPDSNTVYLPNKFYSMNGSYFGLFNMANISNNRIWNMPDNSGTVALLSDIPSGGVSNLVDLGDVNISSLTNGDNLTYNTVSGKWENGKDIIDVSYNTLYGLYSSSGLIAGKYYRFNYQTKHVIPYTTVINTAPIEQLIVQAISSNKLDKIAYSPSYPNDIIYYRIDDVNVNASIDSTLFTDFSFGNPYLDIDTQTSNSETNPVASRTGRIYYREDTIKRLSTPYDFRNVKFRRWKLSYPYIVSSNYYLFTNMNYSYGDIIVNGGVIYMARTNFTCNTLIMNLSDTNFFYNITNLLMNIGNKSEPTYISTPLLLKYISATPDVFILFNDNTTGKYNLYLQVDNSSYYDFTTFDNDLVGNDTKSRNIESFNCHIENFIPAWLEQVSWEYYPNIVFGDYSNNVKIGQFSENITIQDSCNIKIGSYCKNVFINSLSANLNQTVLEDRNENIFIDNKNVYNNNSETFFKIGTSNKNVLVSNAYNIKMGDGNKYLLLSGVKETKIGSNNNYIYYFGHYNNDNLYNNNIENYNSYLSINISCYDNFIGNKNSNIYIPQNANSNIIGNKNNFINGIKTSITVEGVPITNFNNNKIGDNNTYITLAGGGNVVENNVSQIFCDDSVLFNNITFKNNSGKLSFTNGGSVAFVGTIFDYNKDIFSSQKTLNIGSNISPDILNNMNYNIVKRSDSTIYSQEINTYTNSTTFTTNMYKLILT